MNGYGAVLLKVLPAVSLEILPSDFPERSEEEPPGDIAVIVVAAALRGVEHDVRVPQEP